MRIWVDADVAPREARDIVGRAGERLDIEVRCVSAGEGTPAHARLMAEVEEGDVVITRGAELGHELVQRGAVVVDIRGGEFTAASIAEGSKMEQLLASINQFSAAGRGPPPYDARAKREFAATLDRVLARLT